MENNIKVTPKEIDDTLQAFFSMIDDDDYRAQGILEFCHRNSTLVADFINGTYLQGK